MNKFFHSLAQEATYPEWWYALVCGALGGFGLTIIVYALTHPNEEILWP